MKETIKKCYLNTFKAEPSDELIDEIMDNLPAYLSYIAKEWGPENNEVKDLTYLFIHSNYKPK